MQDQDVIREFLVESHENLSRLDQELVELEKHPKDAALLASIFRTIHTIKGACGFLAFSTLESITHQAESLLSQLRDGRRDLSPSLVSLILDTVDATRKVLASIEASGEEGPDRFEDLTERLRVAAQSTAAIESLPGPGLMPGPLAEPPDNNGSSGLSEGRKREEDGAKSSAVADANIRVGVGLLDKLMDLVGELVLTRNQILFSRPGEGATVKIKIPLTLAIIPGLVITSGGERFVIPQVSLLELIRLEGDSSEKHIEYVQGTPVYRRRGSLLPIAHLNQVLGLKSAERAEAVSMVVLQAEDRQFGLVVDGINDTQEIVVKPLGKQLKGSARHRGRRRARRARRTGQHDRRQPEVCLDAGDPAFHALYSGWQRLPSAGLRGRGPGATCLSMRRGPLLDHRPDQAILKAEMPQSFEGPPQAASVRPRPSRSRSCRRPAKRHSRNQKVFPKPGGRKRIAQGASPGSV
jgi:chemotaxis protein histidine kinase CheA